jgi:hypothetical protein
MQGSGLDQTGTNGRYLGRQRSEACQKFRKQPCKPLGVSATLGLAQSEKLTFRNAGADLCNFRIGFLVAVPFSNAPPASA